MKGIISYSRKNLTLMYTIIKVVTVILTIFAIIFVHNILSDEFISAKKYMELGVIQTASNLNGRIINSVNEMKLLALKMSNETQNFSDKSISDFLKSHLSDYDFYKFLFVSSNGKVIIVEKDKNFLSKVNQENELNFNEIKNNSNLFIKTIPHINVPSGYVNTIGISVDGGKGMLISQVFGQKYIKILKYNDYNGKGNSSIINSEGEYIIRPENINSSNFFDDDIKFINTSKEEILLNLRTKKNGSFIFLKNKDKYIASYAVIDMTNNYVFTIVPQNVITLQINKMLLGIVIIVFIIAILLISLIYFSTELFKKHEELIYKMAFTDELTGGGNKTYFLLKAKEILENKMFNYAVISVGITGFRAINELYGKKRTDEIIKDIYSIIQKYLPEGSICTRNYSSEFSVLYKFDDNNSIKEKFIDKINEEIQVYNSKVIKEKITDNEAPKTTQIKLIYGIYICDGSDVGRMYEKAYFAKTELKNNVFENSKYYDEQMRLQMLNEKKIEAEMQNALKEKQFKMYLQPKFNILTKELSGAEALVRWIHPEKGVIPPGVFIPIFEKNGFISELDRYIWEEAVKFIKDIKQNGQKLFTISVNVSRIHMNNDCFISELVNLTKENDINPEYLELEVTESACFDDENRFKEILNLLKKQNFHISMDDFGTGYSSLNMLRHLPVDIVKLDMGFIKDSIKDEKTRIIIESIVQMADRLGMKTVAEGIETEEQLNFLKQINCNYGQGYLFGKPVDVETFTSVFVKDLREINP